jgi:hypothetical protein
MPDTFDIKSLSLVCGTKMFSTNRVKVTTEGRPRGIYSFRRDYSFLGSQRWEYINSTDCGITANA